MLTVSSHGHSQQASFLRGRMEKVFELSTPIILVISLAFLMVICTLIMLVDYQIKKVKYNHWKAKPSSGYSTPTEGCKSYTLIEDINTSLSTISDYVPLVEENLIKQRTKQSKSVPPTPVCKERRRLLKRSETMAEHKIRIKNKRKFSLPPKVSKSKLYMSVDTIDGDDEREENIKDLSETLASVKSLKMKKKMSRKIRRRPPTTISSSTTAPDSSSSSLHKATSEDTLKQAKSVSEFSCISNEAELEYDLYDCHIDNAMAAPGSLFAPAYWDTDLTPTEELELDQLFKDAAARGYEDAHRDFENSDDRIMETNSTVNSPVTMRTGHSARKPLITSITSDLTASISSAISESTLVGDMMDTSCYYSGEEEPKSLMLSKERKNLMNLTHIEEIQFVDD